MREDLIKDMFNECGVAALLGIEVTEATDGIARGRLSIRKEYLNVFGDLHGGITFAFADHIGGACSNTLPHKTVLLESSIHYTRGTRGREVFAEAVLTHCGKKIGRVDTKVYDDSGAIVAFIHQIFYIMKDEHAGTASQNI
ncbi:MAG: PaaI family thioesterase [Syntrophobacterales bacterium]|nr:PaaI family thioesterase [Syntrophobacterales bacterium]